MSGQLVVMEAALRLTPCAGDRIQSHGVSHDKHCASGIESRVWAALAPRPSTGFGRDRIARRRGYHTNDIWSLMNFASAVSTFAHTFTTCGRVIPSAPGRSNDVSVAPCGIRMVAG